MTLMFQVVFSSLAITFLLEIDDQVIKQLLKPSMEAMGSTVLAEMPL